MNISAALGVAVREFPMLTGEVDYLLYVSGKAIGVLEAKPKGHPLIGVETQASRYSGASRRASPPTRVRYRSRTRAPAPSRSSRTCWSLIARSREVFTFHRPEELLRLVSLDSQVRGKLKALPALDARQAVVGAEESDREPGAVTGQEQRTLADPDGDRQRQDVHGGECLLPAHQVRRGEAGAVPRGPQQPRAADLPGVPAVRQPRERLRRSSGSSPHLAVEHVARAVAPGMAISDGPSVPLTAQIQDVLQDDPREVSGGPLPERTQALCRSSDGWGRGRLPRPVGRLPRTDLSSVWLGREFEPPVQEAQQDDDLREQRFPGRLRSFPAVGAYGLGSVLGGDVAAPRL